MRAVRIGLVGDYSETILAHQAIPKALDLAGTALDVNVDICWLGTNGIAPKLAEQFSHLSGLWCVPGSPYKNTDGALLAISYARETGLPFFGSCGGFQHTLIEYARNVLSMEQAAHAELDPESEFTVIAPLSCSLVEKSGGVTLLEGSRLREMYGTREITEKYHCNYGLNPLYENLFETTPLLFCAWDSAGEVRAVELTSHPFFFATLFQPERSAFDGAVHPLIRAFVAAASC